MESQNSIESVIEEANRIYLAYMRVLNGLCALMDNRAADFEKFSTPVSKEALQILRDALQKTLYFLAVGTEPREPVNLYEWLIDTRLEASCGVGVKIEQPEQLIKAAVGTAQLYQILYNLINNAKEHGKATLVTISISLDLDKDGGYIKIRVEDDGTGMDDDGLAYVKMVLDPEYSLSETIVGAGEEGADRRGIGTRIIKGAIESLGGRIEFESKPDSGTIFTIFLPYTENKGNSSRNAAELARNVAQVMQDTHL